MSSRKASFVADAFGATRNALLAEHEAHADGAKVLPADAGTDGLAAGAIPHDRRGALVRDADAVDRSSVVERCGSRTRARHGHRIGVELDEAGRRRRGQQRAVVHVLDGRVRADDRGAQPARPDVDDEDAHGMTCRVASLRDEPADDADRSHQQQVEDVDRR